MTVRRLNYTGCQRIKRADVEIVLDGDSVPPHFTCGHSLDGYRFPGDALVMIEAQAHWTLMRFECGTVELPSSDESLALTEFDSPDGIGFRLKVIGTGKAAGLILGEADGIRPADIEGRDDARSFLAVQPADLGHVVWRLSFAGVEPLLQVNDKIADWRSFMRRREVQALLVPELYRQLLREAFRNPPDAEARDSWQSAVVNMVPAAAGPPPSEADIDSVDDWVDDAVGLFATRHKLLRGLGDWYGAES